MWDDYSDAWTTKYANKSPLTSEGNIKENHWISFSHGGIECVQM